MRIGIGIVLIVSSLMLFTVLLPENTPWILVTSPLFLVGFVLILSKIHEMEEDILFHEVELKKLRERIETTNEKRKEEE